MKVPNVQKAMNYESIYQQLIENARNRKAPLLFEKHHAIPRCLGGDDSKHNIVYLTYREHFIAHHLLVRFKQGKEKIKMQFAFGMMSMHSKTNNYRKHVSSHLFDAAKTAAKIARIYLNIKDEGVCKGRKWYTDGETKYRLLPSHPAITELKLKPYSLAGRKWYTDGTSFLMLYPNDPRAQTLIEGAPAKGKPKAFSQKVCEDRSQMLWFNNGITNTKLKPDDPRAQGLIKGRLKLSEEALKNLKEGCAWKRTAEHNQQNSDRQKGGSWFNDGTRNFIKKPTEQVQPHWEKGRIQRHHLRSNA